MNIPLLVTMLLGAATLGRLVLLIFLSYLALRNSQPGERDTILRALGSVIKAVGVTRHECGRPGNK